MMKLWINLGSPESVDLIYHNIGLTASSSTNPYLWIELFKKIKGINSSRGLKNCYQSKYFKKENNMPS